MVIRGIILYLAVILFLIFSTPLILVTYILGKTGHQRKKDALSRAVIKWAFSTCLFITGSKFTIEGQENIPDNQAVLYIGNHNSYADIVVSYIGFTGITGFISKDLMGKVPIFSIWMKYIHCKLLDRKDLKKGMQTILDAIEDINNDVSICIFPEGTRNKTGDELKMNPFHEGSFRVSTKSGCPIIPMAITGTYPVMEAQQPWIKPSTINIRFGKPIDPKNIPEEYGKKIGAYTQDVIYGMLCDMKGLDPATHPLTFSNK